MSPKLDAKDRKILFMLSKNSRMPLAGIAKKANLSRDGVKYRIRRMETAGVLRGFRTLINVGSLGYSSYHILLRLDYSDKKNSGFIQNAVENKNVSAVIGYSGIWDLEVVVIAKSPEDFNETMLKIISGYNINGYELLMSLGKIKDDCFPYSLWEGFERLSLKQEATAAFKLHQIDSKILSAIAENARMPVIEISKKVQKTPETVVKRMRNLINCGIIREFRPVIDYNRLGLSFHAILLRLQNLDSDKRKRLINFVKATKNIIWSAETFGRWNLMAYAITRDQDELHNTMMDLKKNFGNIIEYHEALIQHSIYKYNPFPEGVYQS